MQERAHFPKIGRWLPSKLTPLMAPPTEIVQLWLTNKFDMFIIVKVQMTYQVIIEPKFSSLSNRTVSETWLQATIRLPEKEGHKRLPKADISTYPKSA